MIGKQKPAKLPRILVAVGDHELRALLKHVAERAAYAVDECSSRSELRNRLDSLSGAGVLEKFDLLLFDKRLLDQTAMKIIRGAQQRQRSPPLVLVKGWCGESHADVDGLAIAAVIDKPADVAKCTLLIRELAPHRNSP